MTEAEYKSRAGRGEREEMILNKIQAGWSASRVMAVYRLTYAEVTALADRHKLHLQQSDRLKYMYHSR
jgi:uncharacterized protein (DUF433 family)